MFSTLLKAEIIILVTFTLSSANPFNLDQAKVLSFGKVSLIPNLFRPFLYLHEILKKVLFIKFLNLYHGPWICILIIPSHMHCFTKLDIFSSALYSPGKHCSKSINKLKHALTSYFFFFSYIIPHFKKRIRLYFLLFCGEHMKTLQQKYI